MKVKSISFATDWEDDPSIANQKIDVLVQSEDNYTYVLVVATGKYIRHLMDKENKNYFGPGTPVILVKELTRDIIEKTVKDYAEQDHGYWLKSSHFAGEIDKIVFDKLRIEEIEY